MTTLQKVFECAHVAEEKRASGAVLLEVSKLTSYADYILILSASSDRRVKTIAEAVRDAMLEAGVKALGIEGLKDGKWVLIDFGSWVVHVFYEEVRPLFNLEGLWADAQRIPIPPAPPRPASAASANDEVEAEQ